MNNLIKSLYTDFKTSVITSEFRTHFIPVGRGVLQGDCLSPLLFNMCFNTYIFSISKLKSTVSSVSPSNFLIQSTGFSLPMMLLLLLVKSRKSNISLIDSLSGVNGPTWLLELINVAHLASKKFYQNLPSTCRSF